MPGSGGASRRTQGVGLGHKGSRGVVMPARDVRGRTGQLGSQASQQLTEAWSQDCLSGACGRERLCCGHRARSAAWGCAGRVSGCASLAGSELPVCKPWPALWPSALPPCLAPLTLPSDLCKDAGDSPQLSAGWLSSEQALCSGHRSSVPTARPPHPEVTVIPTWQTGAPPSEPV